MPWTRRPLASSAAEYDAVIEFTALVVNQAVARQAPIALPIVRLPARNVAGPAPSSPSTGAGTTAATVSVGATVELSLAQVNQSALRFSSSAVHPVAGDLLVRLTIRNESVAPVVLVASPTLGTLPRPASSPVVLAAGAIGTLDVHIANVPPGAHPIQLRVSDLSPPALELLLDGTLVVGSSVPGQGTQPGSIPSQPVEVPGLHVRASRQATVEATPRTFAVDLEAALGGTVHLACAVSVSIETTESRTQFTDRPMAIDERGRLTGLAFGTEYSVTRRSAEARLRLVAPLQTQVDPSTRVVEVSIDLAAATVALTASDPEVLAVQTDLEQQFRAALIDHATQRATGSRIQVAPRISLVGALRAGEVVTELSFHQVVAQVLAPAGPGGRSVLMVALALAANTRAKGTPDNFVGAADFGVVISAAVVRATAAFRWRVNDYPRVLLGRPIEDKYGNDDVLVYPQMHQTSITDGNGVPVAGLREAGQRTYGTSTGVYTFLMDDATATVRSHPEDHVLLGGLGDFEIASVVRKDNHQSLGDAARQAYETPDALKGVLFQWSFSMSSVAQPPTVADPNVQTFLQSVRTGVTRHLSRPFAAEHAITLLSREPNGVEGLILSLGTISL
jgi:hypothetical protein